MKFATISSKGQITIPRQMQQQLGMTTNSKVVLYPQKGILMVKPLTHSIVEQTAGSLRRYIAKDKLGKSFHEILQETKQQAAESLATKP